MKKNFKNTRGITLVALVITIIILVILAGISIQAITNNGVSEKAKLAKEKQDNAEIEEGITLGEYENTINKYVQSNRDIKLDEYTGTSSIASSNDIKRGYYAYNSDGNVIEGNFLNYIEETQSIQVSVPGWNSSTAGGISEYEINMNFPNSIIAIKDLNISISTLAVRSLNFEGNTIKIKLEDSYYLSYGGTMTVTALGY